MKAINEMVCERLKVVAQIVPLSVKRNAALREIERKILAGDVEYLQADAVRAYRINEEIEWLTRDSRHRQQAVDYWSESFWEGGNGIDQ